MNKCKSIPCSTKGSKCCRECWLECICRKLNKEYCPHDNKYCGNYILKEKK